EPASRDRAPVNHAATANNDFAFDLYGQLARQKKGRNLFFSPYSVSSALVIVAEGARNETADEMGKALRFPPAIRRTGPYARVAAAHLEVILTGTAALNRRLQAPNRPPPRPLLQELASLRKALEEANTLVKRKNSFEAASKARKLAAQINKLQEQIDRYE